MKKLNIFGKEIDVCVEKFEDQNYAGHYDPVNDKITISDACTQKFHTYMHELLHAAWYRMGLNQTSISSDIQEIIVENIATVIMENFKEILEAKESFNKENKKMKKEVAKS